MIRSGGSFSRKSFNNSSQSTTGRSLVRLLVDDIGNTKLGAYNKDFKKNKQVFLIVCRRRFVPTLVCRVPNHLIFGLH